MVYTTPGYLGRAIRSQCDPVSTTPGRWSNFAVAALERDPEGGVVEVALGDGGGIIANVPTRFAQ